MLLEHCAPPPLLRHGCYESETRCEQNAAAPVLLAHDQNKINPLQRFLYNLAMDIARGRIFASSYGARALYVNETLARTSPSAFDYDAACLKTSTNPVPALNTALRKSTQNFCTPSIRSLHVRPRIEHLFLLLLHNMGFCYIT